MLAQLGAPLRGLKLFCAGSKLPVRHNGGWCAHKRTIGAPGNYRTFPNYIKLSSYTIFDFEEATAQPAA